MTLPPRLTDQTFPAEPGAAARIVARARRRRRTRAGGALAVAASFAAAVALLMPRGETASLQPVDGPVRIENSAPRETVPNRPDVPCGHADTVKLQLHGTVEQYMTCTRYSWPGTQRYGEPITFTAEWCALDRDLTAHMVTWPGVTVLSQDEGLQWHLSQSDAIVASQTLRAQTCWRWHVRWNGVGEKWDGASYAGYVRFPRGTYAVDVSWPAMTEFTGAEGTTNPRAHQRLRIR